MSLELDRLERLHAEATPGQWGTSLDQVAHSVHLVWKGGVFGSIYATQRPGANAAFIAESRNAFGDLLRIARAAEKLVNGLKPIEWSMLGEDTADRLTALREALRGGKG
jgi:hypothetical protein